MKIFLVSAFLLFNLCAKASDDGMLDIYVKAQKAYATVKYETEEYQFGDKRDVRKLCVEKLITTYIKNNRKFKGDFQISDIEYKVDEYTITRSKDTGLFLENIETWQEINRRGAYNFTFTDARNNIYKGKMVVSMIPQNKALSCVTGTKEFFTRECNEMYRYYELKDHAGKIIDGAISVYDCNRHHPFPEYQGG